MLNKVVSLIYVIMSKFGKGPYKETKEVRIIGAEENLPPAVKARLAKKRAAAE